MLYHRYLYYILYLQIIQKLKLLYCYYILLYIVIIIVINKKITRNKTIYISSSSLRNIKKEANQQIIYFKL